MKARKQVPIRNLIIILVSLLVFMLLLMALRQSPEWIMRWYSSGFYLGVCQVLHPVFNLFPFSAGDLIYIIIILLLIGRAFRLLRFLFIRQPEKAGRMLLKFFICLQIAWIWFYCFWGLNYYRPPAATLLGLNDTTYTIKDVGKVAAILIDSANACRYALDPEDIHQSNTVIYQHAADAVNQLSSADPRFRAIAPRVKPSLFSHVLNYIGVSGYYNPFTSEAQLNYLMPFFDKTFIACHEMAHQTGFAREDEANFAGFAAGVNSRERLLRYSTYYAGVEEFMRYLRRRDTTAHRALRMKISPKVMNDFKTDSIYWTRFQGNAEMISGIFYDQFLKANNQPRGLRTYNRMILLTMAYYRKRYKAW